MPSRIEGRALGGASPGLVRFAGPSLIALALLAGCSSLPPPGRHEAAIDALRGPLAILGRELQAGDLAGARRQFVLIGRIYETL